MIYLDERIDEHPKFVELHPEACWLWVQLLAYCRRNKTDGQVPKSVPSRVHHGSKKLATLIGQLLESPPSRPDLGPLLHRTEHGYELHHYLDWNRSKADLDEALEQKREAGRKGGVAKALAGGKHSASGLPAPDPGIPNPYPQIPIPKSLSPIHGERDPESPPGGVDPYGIAPPGENPDAYPGSVQPLALAQPTPKTRTPKAKPPKGPRPDLDPSTLTSEQREAYEAIVGDPTLAPITNRPAELARDLVTTWGDRLDLPTVIRAGGMYARSAPRPYTDGARFLTNQCTFALEKPAMRSRRPAAPPSEAPRRMRTPEEIAELQRLGRYPKHPPRPPETLEELKARHAEEALESKRRAAIVPASAGAIQEAIRFGIFDEDDERERLASEGRGT